jgi:hypothetical protein
MALILVCLSGARSFARPGALRFGTPPDPPDVSADAVSLPVFPVFRACYSPVRRPRLFLRDFNDLSCIWRTSAPCKSPVFFCAAFFLAALHRAGSSKRRTEHALSTRPEWKSGGTPARIAQQAHHHRREAVGRQRRRGDEGGDQMRHRRRPGGAAGLPGPHRPAAAASTARLHDARARHARRHAGCDQRDRAGTCTRRARPRRGRRPDAGGARVHPGARRGQARQGRCARRAERRR